MTNGDWLVTEINGDWVDEMTPSGRIVWSVHPPGIIYPSDTNELLNDDWNDRVIVVNPRTNKVVWQYGVTGVPGSAPGYLFKPDGVDLAPPYSLLMRHASTLGIAPFPVPSTHARNIAQHGHGSLDRRRFPRHTRGTS